jgi:NAD+ synthase (glutamine-hydrolysing)
VKIALAQINYHIGNFGGNVAGIKAAIARAREGGADLVVFAELAVCGYPPRDFLEFDDFIDRCRNAVLEIAGACRGITCIVGSPVLNTTGKGKRLFNAAIVLENGTVREEIHKTLLPNYDVFDEYRYFEPNREFRTVVINNEKVAVTICEDLWNTGEEPLYVNDPMKMLSRENPGLIINIAASPFNYDHPSMRRKVLSEHPRHYGIPLFYVNHVGGHTELLFDGSSMVFGPDGGVFSEMNYFREDFRIFDLDEVRKSRSAGREDFPVPGKIPLIHDALVMGVENYFDKLGFKKAILGLSGGIDSAVTLVIAARALGTENVRAVLLPSAFSSDHSVKDAIDLANNLGCPYDIIPIEESFRSMQDTLKPVFKDLPFNLTEENIQARLRGVILMALSNKFGYILLNTSNKSEAAVGYGTLYGDMNGGISVLGDVYKTEVYELADYINRDEIIIPESTIQKPPSAELRPGQKDSDSLPEYHILDPILYNYIELRKGPEDIIAEGFDPDLVRKVLRMVNTNEYKRYQTPPILRVSPKAFGMGRRMPIVARYLA